MLWYCCAVAGAEFVYKNIDVYKYNGSGEGMCARVGKEREKHEKIVRDYVSKFKQSLK